MEDSNMIFLEVITSKLWQENMDVMFLFKDLRKWWGMFTFCIVNSSFILRIIYRYRFWRQKLMCGNSSDSLTSNSQVKYFKLLNLLSNFLVLLVFIRISNLQIPFFRCSTWLRGGTTLVFLPFCWISIPWHIIATCACHCYANLLCVWCCWQPYGTVYTAHRITS